MDVKGLINVGADGPHLMGRAREIVVGVDGSPGAISAVWWAAEEAALRGCGLLLVHAADPHGYGLWTSARIVRDALREMAQPHLDRAAALALLASPGVPIRTRAMVGGTSRALLMLSRDAELTVVGQSGRADLARTMLGSIAERVLADAASPAVAVPRHEPGAERVPMARVVTAVDGPQRHQRTLAFAFGEAHRHHLGVHIVHVADRDSTPLDLDPTEWIADWQAAHPDVAVTVETRAGALSASLRGCLRESDLLVIGHHRGDFLPELLGRHGRDLLRLARCPVAVLAEDADPIPSVIDSRSA